jgi:hypothetical protein
MGNWLVGVKVGSFLPIPKGRGLLKAGDSWPHDVDEYRLMVLPIALGHGKVLFGGLQEGLKLKLLATRVFASGTILHQYRSADML